MIGVGYLAAAHVTSETLALIRGAGRLFFLVDDPVIEQWLLALNPTAMSLADGAIEGTPLRDCCRNMAKQVMSAVRDCVNICVVFSGHPGIAVDPAHEILRRAKAEGHQAKMFPAVSALDCIFADLGIDPAHGCQFFEAETLIEMNYRLDPTSSLILFQPGVIGVQRHTTPIAVSTTGIRRLTRLLQKYYPSPHEVIVYEAASLPIAPPRIERAALRLLPKLTLTPISTLYVPRVAGG